VKLRWITNIPTPYRNHRHRLLASALAARGVDYAVYYMAWTEPDRHWSAGFHPGALDHPHRIFSGLHPAVGGVSFHLNPGLLATLASDRPEVVVIGGWAIPTLLLAPLVTRRSVRLLGVESNPDSVRHGGGVAARIRAAMVRDATGFLIPSEPSRTLITRIDPASADKPVLVLPNLVDEAVWRDGVARLDGDAERAVLGVTADQQLWVCPARLEAFKGVHLLLPLLEGERRVVLAIAGEGSLRDELQRQIDERRLPVRLLGQCDQARMQRLYAAADLFVLPSLQDPSPLSAVEAAASGLPLWISRRCGNADDVVAVDDNGWRYDPDDTPGNRATLARIAALGRAELAARGRRSVARYQARFDSRTCIDRIADQLVALGTRA
jgi:glycosyltransferase involved in cell wall biosynthesis